MLHVSLINCCPKGDVIQRHTKPTHPIYNLHVQWTCCFHMPVFSFPEDSNLLPKHTGKFMYVDYHHNM